MALLIPCTIIGSKMYNIMLQITVAVMRLLLSFSYLFSFWPIKTWSKNLVSAEHFTARNGNTILILFIEEYTYVHLYIYEDTIHLDQQEIVMTPTITNQKSLFQLIVLFISLSNMLTLRFRWFYKISLIHCFLLPCYGDSVAQLRMPLN